MNGVRRNALALRRVAALVCAGAYLLGGTELLPECLAFGAWLEGSHAVHLGLSPDRLSVVLSHEHGAPGRIDYTPCQQAGNPLHRHGAAARLLCLLADQPSGNPDHVANFAAAPVCERAARLNEAKPNLTNPVTAPARPAVLADNSLAAAVYSSRSQGPSPPSDNLRSLRSTVLVL